MKTKNLQPINEIPSFVLTNGPGKFANRFFDKELKRIPIDPFKESCHPKSLEWASIACYEELELVLPYGEQKQTQSTESAVLIEQQGISYIKPLKDMLKPVARVIPNYFSRWEALPEFENHDICNYCGTSNGLHSELRVDFDCYACGCN